MVLNRQAMQFQGVIERKIGVARTGARMAAVTRLRLIRCTIRGTSHS
jgi:hypothetical protein